VAFALACLGGFLRLPGHCSLTPLAVCPAALRPPLKTPTPRCFLYAASNPSEDMTKTKATQTGGFRFGVPGRIRTSGLWSRSTQYRIVHHVFWCLAVSENPTSTGFFRELLAIAIRVVSSDNCWFFGVSLARN